MARNKTRIEAEKRALAVIELHRKDKEIDRLALMPELEQACKDLQRRSFETFVETAWEDAVKKLTREHVTEQAWLPGFVPPETVLVIGKHKIVYLDVGTPDQFMYGFKNRRKNMEDVINAFKPWQNTKKKIIDGGYWTPNVTYPEALEAYLRDHPEQRPGMAS